MSKVLKKEFRHIENWVFDMDGTLYSPESGMEDAIWEAWFGFFGERARVFS